MRGLKGGPEIPAWALPAVIVVGIVILVVIAFRTFGAGGPRDPSTFPEEAFRPPGYTSPSGQSPYGPRPDGGSPPAQPGPAPMGGAAPGAAPGQPGANPYTGAYGERPGGP